MILFLLQRFLSPDQRDEDTSASNTAFPKWLTTFLILDNICSLFIIDIQNPVKKVFTQKKKKQCQYKGIEVRSVSGLNQTKTALKLLWNLGGSDKVPFEKNPIKYVLTLDTEKMDFHCWNTQVLDIYGLNVSHPLKLQMKGNCL